MKRRWRLPKGILQGHLAIEKRRFPPRPCSGIDSTMAGSWQRAGVNEEKAANSVLQRWTEGPRDGGAYRDMTAMHPADSTHDRAAVSPARRQTFLARLFGACERVHFLSIRCFGPSLGEVEGAKGCRTRGIYFQVGRLRTNSKVWATWAPSPGVLALLAGCAAPAPAGD